MVWCLRLFCSFDLVAVVCAFGSLVCLWISGGFAVLLDLLVVNVWLGLLGLWVLLLFISVVIMVLLNVYLRLRRIWFGCFGFL